MTERTPATMSLEDALKTLLARGQTIVTANEVANVMWPDARQSNTKGQVFNLSAGVAGRLLSKSRAAFAIRHRRWQIVPEYLGLKSDWTMPPDD